MSIETEDRTSIRDKHILHGVEERAQVDESERERPVSERGSPLCIDLCEVFCAHQAIIISRTHLITRTASIVSQRTQTATMMANVSCKGNT